MAVVIKWHGPELLRRIQRSTAGGIQLAAQYYYTQCQLALSVPNTGVRVRRTRATRRGKAGSTYTIYPNPSRPGESPRLRTAHGRSNVIHEHDARIPASRVGVRKNALYLVMHELGIRGVKRPWLLPTLIRTQAVMARLMQVGSSKYFK